MQNKISSKKYWDNYYQQKSVDEIPWSGVNSIFFDNIWKSNNIPKKGNILDVGCGRGDKAIFLAEKGYMVWGFDVSKKAIEFAIEASKKMKNRPHFFQSNATSLTTLGDIKNIKFDIILDKLVSQFLSIKEKDKYLSSIKQHLKIGKTFYILQCFGKDKLSIDQYNNLAEWVKKIALSSKQVEEIYGRYFSFLDIGQKVGIDGREVDTFIMKASGIKN